MYFLRLPSQNTITVCLITTEICCFSVLEATSPKSSYQQDQVPSQTYCREFFPASFWPEVVCWQSLTLQHTTAALQSLLFIIWFSPIKSVLRCPSSYYTSNTGLRAHPTTFPGSSDGKLSAYNVGDPGSIPGSGRSSGEGNGNPLLYSCLENPMDWGSW